MLPISDYQTIMLPLVKYASDRSEHSSEEAVEALALIFQLIEEVKKVSLRSRNKIRLLYDQVH
jgi:restriction system protein